MEAVKILWLYDELLDLYGDSGNMRALEFYFHKYSIPYQIDHQNVYDHLNFEGYDLVYCGPGKLKNIIVAAKHLKEYRSALLEAINSGTVMLFTGSALMTLLRSFKDVNGKVYEGANIFDYTATDVDKVLISDVISYSRFFDNAIYGFVNRTATLDQEIKNPFFIIDQGLKDKGEGLVKQNLLATWQCGPLLVKNPELLQYYFKRLTDVELDLSDSLEMKAYQKTMNEFKKK